MKGYNFTERVRKVLAKAREEAAHLHHQYVGTEHILLGMTAEGEGVGIAVLTNLGVNLDELREMIISTVKTGRADVTGPDLPYTSPAKKVLELAMAEARELNHSYVGTEHLLLGLLREEKGIAAQVLNKSGVTLATVRAEVVNLLGETTSRPADTLIAMPTTRIHERQSSVKPLSYTVEIAYDDGIAVRKRCASKEEALKFLMTN